MKSSSSPARSSTQGPSQETTPAAARIGSLSTTHSPRDVTPQDCVASRTRRRKGSGKGCPRPPHPFPSCSSSRSVGDRSSSLSVPRVKKGSARFERPVRGSPPRDRASEGVDRLGCEGLPRVGSGRRIQPGVGRGQNRGEELERALEVGSDPRDPPPAAERCWDDMDRSSLLWMFVSTLSGLSLPFY